MTWNWKEVSIKDRKVLIRFVIVSAICLLLVLFSVYGCTQGGGKFISGERVEAPVVLVLECIEKVDEPMCKEKEVDK